MIPIVDIKILIAMILISPYLFTCSILFQGADPSPTTKANIERENDN